MSFLDITGLRRLWANILLLIDHKLDMLTTDDIDAGEETIVFNCGTSTDNAENYTK